MSARLSAGESPAISDAMITRWIKAAICGAVILPVGQAAAHGGFENETEVRVYPDRMRLVLRASEPFAWRILGERAPATTDEATAKPLLAAAATGLFKVTAGGNPMTPVKSECFFELEDHVAFAIDFERPDTWPVTLEATFFPLLGELDEGSIAVFDQTGSRFNREIEPLVRKSITLNDPTLSFDLRAPLAADLPATPPAPAGVPQETLPDKSPAWILPLLFVTAGLTVLLCRAVWRHSRRAS